MTSPLEQVLENYRKLGITPDIQPGAGAEYARALWEGDAYTPSPSPVTPATTETAIEESQGEVLQAGLNIMPALAGLAGLVAGLVERFGGQIVTWWGRLPWLARQALIGAGTVAAIKGITGLTDTGEAEPTPEGGAVTAPGFPTGGIPYRGRVYTMQEVAKSWLAGDWPFFLLSDGLIATPTASGTWRVYRPKRNIVIPRRLDRAPVGVVVKNYNALGKILDKVDRAAHRRRRR